MAPLDLQPHKYFAPNEKEKVFHEYFPALGGKVIDNPNIIYQQILVAQKSGVDFERLNIAITNKRIRILLKMPYIVQELEIPYQDLRIISVSNNWLGPRSVALEDDRGLKLWLHPTRPHYVAVELWVMIAAAIGQHYHNLGKIEDAYSLISGIGVSTLKVPDDFLALKGEKYAADCSRIGLCLPVNQPPYFLPIPVNSQSEPNLGKSLASSHNTSAAIATQPLQAERKASFQAGDIVTSSTANAVSSGLIEAATGKVPIFRPSLAAIPAAFNEMRSLENELNLAIQNAPAYFQSFYNDLEPLTKSGFNDDVISANCFDEDLYCALIREMHRYTLAEVSANQDQIAKSNAGLGAMVGSLLGLITGNIFAPFLGHTYGKNMTDRSRRIEEFLPDPKLLFNQDINSYLSWSRGQVSFPRLRRLIIDRQIDANGRVYFRLVPAIVTADSVYPIQLFKLEPSSYFYRPLAAGIGDDAGRNQPNYDPIKIQRKYFHIRAEGEVNPTDISLKVYGQDIEDYSVKLYRYTGHSLDYFYADFKIQPGSVF